MDYIDDRNIKRSIVIILSLTFILQTEARKAELETKLTTNLRRRKQELEAVISSVEADSLVGDAESKKQELSDAKKLVDGASEELKSENFTQYCLLSIFESQDVFPCLTNFLPQVFLKK